jgi:hypothetical protein
MDLPKNRCIWDPQFVRRSRDLDLHWQRHSFDDEVAELNAYASQGREHQMSNDPFELEQFSKAIANLLDNVILNELEQAEPGSKAETVSLFTAGEATFDISIQLEITGMNISVYLIADGVRSQVFEGYTPNIKRLN